MTKRLPIWLVVCLLCATPTRAEEPAASVVRCEKDSPLHGPCLCEALLCGSRQLVDDCANAASCCQRYKPAYLDLANQPPERVEVERGWDPGVVLGVTIPAAIVLVVAGVAAGYALAKVDPL